jgi:hypothetical protein
MPVPVMVIEQGRKIAACEQPWSTMISMALCPLLFGKPRDEIHGDVREWFGANG